MLPISDRPVPLPLAWDDDADREPIQTRFPFDCPIDPIEAFRRPDYTEADAREAYDE